MKKLKPGTDIVRPEARRARVVSREGGFLIVECTPPPDEEYFERAGAMPLLNPSN